MTVRSQLDVLLAQPVADLGLGRTGERWRSLYRWARTGPVSVARLAEAHLDATAIFEDAGQRPHPASTYGVWASGGPRDTLTFDPNDRTVVGVKPFASGLGVVDRALVTATCSQGRSWLLDIDASDLALTGEWASPALLDTHTGDAVIATRQAGVVGGPNFYLDRIGFWHAATGPAACWAGGASGIVDVATRELATDPYRRAAQGRLLAQQRLLEAVLAQNGHLIDNGLQTVEQARAEAHTVRHLVERACATIIDEFSQAFGPRPFVSNADLAQRVMDVQLYCRQQHGNKDLAALATSVLVGTDS